MNCYEILKDDLRGYSPDTIVELVEESLPVDECEALLAMLEVQYG
jgi:hypothetical protein